MAERMCAHQPPMLRLILVELRPSRIRRRFVRAAGRTPPAKPREYLQPIACLATVELVEPDADVGPQSRGLRNVAELLLPQ